MAAEPAPPADATERKAPEQTSPRADRLPPFRVLLHNDDENDMFYVVETLVELTPLTKSQATQVMLEAHMSGCSLVLTTHKERAELYRDQFRSRFLVASIESAD